MQTIVVGRDVEQLRVQILGKPIKIYYVKGGQSIFPKALNVTGVSKVSGRGWEGFRIEVEGQSAPYLSYIGDTIEVY